MSNPEIYVELILPLPLNMYYTYRVPEELHGDVEVGKRVIVQFGSKKFYTGVIAKVTNKSPEGYDIKDILSLPDEYVVVTELYLKFWHWVSEYYMCPIGDVFKAALPNGLKLESRSKILLNDDRVVRPSDLSGNENMVYNYLLNNDKNELSSVLVNFSGKTSPLSVKNAIPVIKSLVEKKIISLEENISDKYKPKKSSFIKLSEVYQNEKTFSIELDMLENKPKQHAILIKFAEFICESDNDYSIEISKSKFLSDGDLSQSSLKTLQKNGVLEQIEREESRLVQFDDEVVPPKILNDAQSEALKQIKGSFEEKDVVLLHGVTSSGKTEIYIHLIQEQLDKGNQVLFLLPEIALTAQIINRLRKVFGNRVGVYHSKFNDNERVEVWNNIINSDIDTYDIVLGVRSAIFLPFKKLGMVIVDEEHETTYKQFNPSPRYNARDISIVLSHFHKAKVLLGSATPSIESYHNSISDKYGYVSLTERYKGIKLPETEVVDLKKMMRQNLMKSYFSVPLLRAMENSLAKGHQIILFQNRRGFSPFVQCDNCGWVPKCKHCDVSLTYHKYSNSLNCHYCEFSLPIPKKCSKCGSPQISTKGFGTEKIEDELSIYLPDAKVARLDQDTTRSKNAYERIISSFENREVDILVGTQMLSKGLDFDNVRLVGVLNADTIMNFPDFRAYERAFQLICQVSGRAGRKGEQGKVVLQTYEPTNDTISQIINNDYKAMFKQQSEERQMFKYPPYFRMIKMTLRHKNMQTLETAARIYASNLTKIFGRRVLGPEKPVVSRIQSYYLRNITLKIEKTASHQRAKQILFEELDNLRRMNGVKSVDVMFDVDPM